MTLLQNIFLKIFGNFHVKIAHLHNPHESPLGVHVPHSPVRSTRIPPWSACPPLTCTIHTSPPLACMSPTHLHNPHESPLGVTVRNIPASRLLFLATAAQGELACNGISGNHENIECTETGIKCVVKLGVK